MSTVFIGGSRHVSRLPAQAKDRLNNVIESGFPVIVGDANGADKAVQKHLLERGYQAVTVYCSGQSCRNNLGQWTTEFVSAPKDAKGFQFYAVKDREMARAADFGLMIWDGKSAGTLLNVLRLIRASKKAVLLNVPEKSTTTFKVAPDWDSFLAQCSFELRRDLQDRATPDEWRPQQQPSLDLAAEKEQQPPEPPTKSEEEFAFAINTALAAADPGAAADLLGQIAKTRGMSQISKDTGLAREGLYRALRADGNPEFATVLKVINAMGLRLTVNKLG